MFRRDCRLLNFIISLASNRGNLLGGILSAYLAVFMLILKELRLANSRLSPRPLSRTLRPRTFTHIKCRKFSKRFKKNNISRPTLSPRCSRYALYMEWTNTASIRTLSKSARRLCRIFDTFCATEFTETHHFPLLHIRRITKYTYVAMY